MGEASQTKVKKQNLTSSRLITFDLSGQEMISVEILLKKETGFRTKSKFSVHLKSNRCKIYSFFLYLIKRRQIEKKKKTLLSSVRN